MRLLFLTRTQKIRMQFQTFRTALGQIIIVLICAAVFIQLLNCALAAAGL